MWTVIYVSQSLETAQTLTDALMEREIVSKLRRAGVNGEEERKGCFEVLVPNTEMEAAQDIIIENGLF